MRRRISSPGFVGRGPELQALLDALERAAGGEFAAVFVAGESGVGKSRLLRELARLAEERGVRVVGGDCVSLSGGELPYAPLRTALRSLARELGSGALEELLGPGREELARLVPELSAAAAAPPALTDSGERLAQARLFELLLAVFVRLAESEPLVLAIEDIHWADRSTLDFLAFLLANARRERLLLVCSYRTDELHRRQPLRSFVAQNARPPAVERVDVSPFTRTELEVQLRGILGAPPDEALVARLYERTGGNALFTEELLAASTDGTDLPASLRDALMLHIETLPDDAQRVLRMAAAHGRVVSHRLVAAVSELPDDELHRALREAVSQSVLVRQDVDTFAFRHALFQEALEADLLPGERASLHLALAQALEADPTLVARDGRAAAELCAHWLGADRPAEALAAAVRAGKEAEQVFAFSEASYHFERAVDLWDRVDGARERAGMDQGALCAAAAEDAYVSGDGPRAIRLVRRAIDKVDSCTSPYAAAVLHERLGRYLFMATGDTEGAQRAYQEAVGLLPADHPRRELTRVLAALAQILMLRGNTVESVECCDEAIAVARRIGSPADEAHALNTLGVNLCFVGDRRAGIEYLRESLRMSAELGEIDSCGRAYMNLGEALDSDGRFEEAVEVALTGAERLRELGMRDWTLLLHSEAATRLLKLGRLGEADRLTEAAPRLRPSLAKLHQCAARARVEVHRGHLAAAETLLAAADEVGPYAPGPTWIEPLASARLELELLRGEPEEARRRGDETLASVAYGEQVFFTARMYALTARACAVVAERGRAAGDDAASGEAAARARALTERMGDLLAQDRWDGAPPPETLAYRELCEAEAGRAAGVGATAAWSAVAQRWAELGLPLEQAYARLREAECLALERDRDGAEAAVATGLAITAAAGAAWLQSELEALARRARLSVESAVPAVDGEVERLGLTERELAVLELIALGKTNREIGEELFMARKTASVHVSRILAKLGVSSRVEAATVAQRLGIVP